jgi:hypothetical protein
MRGEWRATGAVNGEWRAPDIGWRESQMIRRMLRYGLPVDSGLKLLLAGGAAYLAWEHEQGKHAQPHALCPICWLNKIAPAPERPGPTPSEPEE